MDFQPILLISSFVAFFLALSVHEFAHALIAYYYGDHTAANSGRLTLNPISHIDLFGTILLPLFLILSNTPVVFGWAKPVPVNYYNLRDQKWGPAMISLAGPAANFIFGILSLFLYVFVIKHTNLSQANLLFIFLGNLAFINFILMIFNLIPIPPLDGSKILFALLPDKYQNLKIVLEQYGIFILLIFLVVGVGFVFTISSTIFNIFLSLANIIL